MEREEWQTEESSKLGSEEGNCSSYEGLAVLRSERWEELEDTVNQNFNSTRNLQEQRFEEMNQRILPTGQRIDKHEEKLLVSSRSNLEKTRQDTKQRCLKLKFNSNISVPILTGEQIKGEGGSNLQLSLIDNCTGEVVDSGREASAKVKIVALEGDLDDDEGDAWTAEQLQSEIARDSKGKQSFLAGNLKPKLNKGTVFLSDVKFSSSQRHNSGIFKLGAWVVETFVGSRVTVAKTKSFKVHDYRRKYTQKHYPPSASDEVWRLKNIAKYGATCERLKGANVNYVKDFQTRLLEDPEELKWLVGLRPTQWEDTVIHAQTCKPDNMVGQVPAPAPASAHEDKGIPVDGNIMPALESVNLRRKRKLMERDFEPLISEIVKEKVDLVMEKYLISIRRTCGKEICPSESGSLQLRFLSGISLPVFTGTRIEGQDFKNLKVALVDPFTRQVVSIGPQSAAKVEIVVLEGDFDGDESDNWTFEEFKNNIVREREGKKPLLTGDAVLTLKEGNGVVSDISFTDNSSWTRSRKFRLGARVVDNSDGNRVKEAKTDSFIVRDHRGESSCYTPLVFRDNMLVTSDGSKVLNSHKSGKCDYPEPNTCSDIMPSMYSLGALTNLDEYDLPIMDSMEVGFDHHLNFPGQVTNNTICDTDSMTQDFLHCLL